MQRLNLITFVLFMFILSASAAPRPLKQAKISRGEEESSWKRSSKPKPSK